MLYEKWLNMKEWLIYKVGQKDLYSENNQSLVQFMETVLDQESNIKVLFNFVWPTCL